MKKSITQELIEKYKRTYLENSSRINYAELLKTDNVTTLFYDDLPNHELDAYPIASDLVDENGKVYSSFDVINMHADDAQKLKLRFHFMPNYHELYVGTTGSGKTTGCVEPQIRAISSVKNKPNLFITDPKGEIFERNARHLNNQGYKIFVLNFKEITRSNRWNPLLEMYRKKQELVTLGKGVKLRKGMPKSNLILQAKESEFDGVSYVEYQGLAFPNGLSFDCYVNFKRDYIDAEIDSLVNQFSHMVIKVESSKERSWEYGAQQLLKGLLLCMLEESVTPNSDFTEDMMNIRTLQQYYIRLRSDITTGDYKLLEHPLIKNKPKHAVTPMLIALNNATNTMLSYCGVFDGAIKDWFQGHIFALTTGNTIDISNLTDPYAIFIITRDYEKSDFTVAGLFVDWVYKQALEQAEKAPRGANGLPTTRPLHFLLDEFGNIPLIPDFENKIATSRSRNIWFHLVVQSYEQLKLVYGEERSCIIIDNCNAQVFLGAQSRDTKEMFSKQCGKCSAPTINAYLSTTQMDMTMVDVLPISALDLINPGEMFIKRLYQPVFSSQYIRSYLCANLGIFKHFYDSRAMFEFTPFNINSFTSAQFTFAKLDALNQDDNADDY